ncbi:MAG TPA: hypothetical protein DCY20_03850 [Firmicutes bacterium]|nr:hypothetical protein [Bacillota bacterium]
MVKHGFIGDKKLLTDLLAIQNISEIFNQGMHDLLIRSLTVKQHFVEVDPYEAGVRAFLNFGHTLSHALELVHPMLSHGEGVTIGIAFALYVSEQRFNVPLDLEGYLDYLNAYEYPMPLRYDKMDVYFMSMRHDKKNKNDHIRFVLLKQVGEPLKVSLSLSEVASYLTEFMQFLTDWRERRCL